jgi:5-methylcytosine-specific restriction protein A
VADRRNQRSDEATSYRRLYKSPRWKAIRNAQLRAQPTCERCDSLGMVTAATVCDHTTPHKGNLDLFWWGPFRSLCKPCHDGPKQSEERRGYDTTIGKDGWPIDARHPQNR